MKEVRCYVDSKRTTMDDFCDVVEDWQRLELPGMSGVKAAVSSRDDVMRLYIDSVPYEFKHKK